ncbi:MAG: formylglycine-generating enzyme family protein [Scytonematopsis contorta HA4267-MV1]|jgi:formylglycine-generating enzyme required for sulfatase activity|nr:formylglycine-generating enzyme family protein [Scytonematopsis contorta HA4267-MV1]
MVNLSPSVTQPSNREDLITRRIRVVEQRYGTETLLLAYHAAFPLTITSELLYCLREKFVPCPWYAVADVLLSGLYETIGYDLYEMDGETRDALLRRLEKECGKDRLSKLADFMSQYIFNRFKQNDSDYRWTPLAYFIADGEYVNAIKQKLRELIASSPEEHIKWQKLEEKYADLLSQKGFKPIILKGEQPTDDIEELAKVMGVELKPFEFNVAYITSNTSLGDEPEEELQHEEFETVTVDTRGQIINRKQNQAYYYIEYLGEEAGKSAPLGIDMVAIPGGTFKMGAPKSEPGYDESESPQHQVTVQPFFISKYLVTQAQWRFVAQLPQVNSELGPDPSKFKGDNLPVETVSWYDAVEFCERLSGYTGRTYSLPSEAEWEYACRAGTTTPFYFGETITTKLANYNGKQTYGNAPKGEYRAKTTPVGEFPPNAFGLYDMHGNVWEWCLDDWHNNYKGAPTDGRAWFDNNDNTSQKNKYTVMRGGSWFSNPEYCRSAFRYDPFAGRDSHDYVGFRVVCGVGRVLR